MLEQLCWLGLIMILHVLPPVSVTSIATYIEGYHEKGRLPHTNGEQFDTWSWWHERMAHISDRNSLRYFSSGVFGSELQKRDVQTAVCQISHACNVSISQLGSQDLMQCSCWLQIIHIWLETKFDPIFLKNTFNKWVTSPVKKGKMDKGSKCSEGQWQKVHEKCSFYLLPN